MPDIRFGMHRDLALDSAFQADQRGQPERGEKLDEVAATLHSPTEQRVGQPDLHVRQASPLAHRFDDLGAVKLPALDNAKPDQLRR